VVSVFSAAPGGGGVIAGQFSASIRLAVSRRCNWLLLLSVDLKD